MRWQTFFLANPVKNCTPIFCYFDLFTRTLFSSSNSLIWSIRIDIQLILTQNQLDETVLYRYNNIVRMTLLLKIEVILHYFISFCNAWCDHFRATLYAVLIYHRRCLFNFYQFYSIIHSNPSYLTNSLDKIYSFDWVNHPQNIHFNILKRNKYILRKFDKIMMK